MSEILHDLRVLVLASIALVTGCLADPSAHVAGSQGADPMVRSPSPVFTSIDDAAVAGLVAARESGSWRARQSMQAGTIRRAGDGFVFAPPIIAEGTVVDMRAAVLRIRLSAEDVAIYVIHPPTGSSEIDARNESLNASESRLLGGAGRARPVYLLTPRMRIVRYAIDEPELRVADLRMLPRSRAHAPQAVLVD